MVFYRYELQTTIGFEDFFSTSILVLHEYSLVKETEKGYWICYGSPRFLHSTRKWIPKISKKRFAYPTKEEALNNYIVRTTKRIGYLESNLNRARLGLSYSKKEKQILINK